MRCPICDAPTFVLSTREGINRRRECFNQHRFTTEEVLKMPHKSSKKPNFFKPSKKDWMACYNELKAAGWDLNKAMKNVDEKDSEERTKEALSRARRYKKLVEVTKKERNAALRQM